MSAGGSEIRDPGYRLHKKKPTSCMRNFLHCKQIRKLSYGFLHLFINICNTTTTIKIFIRCMYVYTKFNWHRNASINYWFNNQLMHRRVSILKCWLIPKDE